MSDTINITKIFRPSLREAVSPSLTIASFSGGFYFIMRSDTSNSTSSSRSKLERTFINQAQAYDEGKLKGFVFGSVATSLLSLAAELLLNYLNLI